MDMSTHSSWQPLPKGSFTGTRWSQPGAIDGQDPYLAWAEADHFAGYSERNGSKPPKWLPIVIELAALPSSSSFASARHSRP
jgi:hypothetical protein